MRLVNIIAASLLLFFFVQPVIAEEPKQEERFQKVNESIVLDKRTGLMWATKDIGRDIDWYDAKAYCKEFAAGGYDDWRMPDIKELATLYTHDSKNGVDYFITNLIRITDCCIWSSYETMGGSLAFSFTSGKRPAASLGETYQLRALPVRGIEK